MRTQPTQHGESTRSRKRQQHKLLLVGSGDELKDIVAWRIFDSHRTHVAFGSTSLLDALKRLEADAIDLVMLGREFGEEEIALFIRDARRRGFAGMILHVESAPDRLRKSNALDPPEDKNGQVYFDSGQQVMSGLLLNQEFTTRISFSLKERDVLVRVSKGWTNKQIANDLKCSEGSIKAVLQQLFYKLGVRKRALIVRMAFEKGFRTSR